MGREGCVFYPIAAKGTYLHCCTQKHFGQEGVLDAEADLFQVRPSSSCSARCYALLTPACL